jgi:DnaA family protein
VSQQLALELGLNTGPSFNNFVSTNNEEIVDVLKASAKGEGERFLTLWGPTCSGKSHLLQATCHSAIDQGNGAAYLSLKMQQDIEPEVLSGLEGLSLVGLDDLEAIAGQAHWETALHHFYNRIKEQGGILIGASQLPTRSLPIALADLKSRLNWGPVYQIHPLCDEAKTTVLQVMAQRRGMEISPEVARYLLTHYSREMPQLTRYIEQLDKLSLIEQRRLTLPFVRTHLDPKSFS